MLLLRAGAAAWIRLHCAMKSACTDIAKRRHWKADHCKTQTKDRASLQNANKGSRIIAKRRQWIADQRHWQLFSPSMHCKRLQPLLPLL